jgi:hypothetical protein
LSNGPATFQAATACKRGCAEQERHGRRRSQTIVHSRHLETVLTKLVEAAAAHLQAEIAAGAEVPFELGSQRARRGQTTPLYCYRPLPGAFIAEREAALARLPGHATAVRLLGSFEGLDRYLGGRGLAAAGTGRDADRSTGAGAGAGRVHTRASAALRALLEDVFSEQTDFELRPERLRAALDRLEQAGSVGGGAMTLVATLHGLTIASPELSLTKGLTIAQPDALQGAPPAALTGDGEGEGHLIVVLNFDCADAELEDAIVGGAPDPLARGRELLRDLLRALRLFGDGRVTLGALAWARAGGEAWVPVALGSAGRPRGMLVVRSEQEDELRAFCNLVSRRTPHGNELAWALRRFELGCERAREYEALSDHLLALRALLEPEGPDSGLLAHRLAALCAGPEHREALSERVRQALALEREEIAGTAVEHAGGLALAQELAGHLGALLRDVICGHLDQDLVVLADELLAAPAEEEGEQGTAEGPALPERRKLVPARA